MLRDSPEDTVSCLVNLPSSQNGDITVNRRLEQVLFTVKFRSDLLVAWNDDGLFLVAISFRQELGNTTRFNKRSGSSPGVESGLTSTGSSQSIRNGTLRAELQSDFSGKVGILQGLVVANVREETLLDLP